MFFYISPVFYHLISSRLYFPTFPPSFSVVSSSPGISEGQLHQSNASEKSQLLEAAAQPAGEAKEGGLGRQMTGMLVSGKRM